MVRAHENEQRFEFQCGRASNLKFQAIDEAGQVGGTRAFCREVQVGAQVHTSRQVVTRKPERSKLARQVGTSNGKRRLLARLGKWAGQVGTRHLEFQARSKAGQVGGASGRNKCFKLLARRGQATVSFKSNSVEPEQGYLRNSSFV